MVTISSSDTISISKNKNNYFFLFFSPYRKNKIGKIGNGRKNGLQNCFGQKVKFLGKTDFKTEIKFLLNRSY